MTNISILFQKPMVLALIAGTKTQTRRLARLKRGVTLGDIPRWEGEGMVRRAVFTRDQIAEPRFAVGDRLYVREAWRSSAAYDDLSPSKMGGEEPIVYEADGAHQTWGYPAIAKVGRLRASMHMPRWASRLTLTVTDVRVQRPQDISEADAIAEGVARDGVCTAFASGPIPMWSADGGVTQGDDPINAYSALWDSLNAARGFGWEANPWVVAVSFTVERRNIDEAG